MSNFAEIREMLEGMPAVVVGRDGYTALHRAQDFQAVFNGSSGPEQAQRVYAQLVDLCQGTSWPTDADKPGTLAFKAGQRWVLMEIINYMTVRQPVTVERQEEEHAY